MAYCSRHPGDEKEVNEDGVMPSVEHSSMWSKDCQHYACHPVPTFLPSYDVNDRTDALYEFDGSTGSYFVQTDQQFQYCDRRAELRLMGRRGTSEALNRAIVDCMIVAGG